MSDERMLSIDSWWLEKSQFVNESVLQDRMRDIAIRT